MEEVARFILNLKKITAEIKSTRHRLRGAISRINRGSRTLIGERDAKRDVGRNLVFKENKRSGVEDVFFANAQRTKESLRVLEEFGKLIDKNCAKTFKSLRYKTYEIEKKVAQKF